jgi:Protein of unknown function (DUF2971)
MRGFRHSLVRRHQHLTHAPMPTIQIPRLFKYMSATRLMAMLKQPSIRFTQPSALNDPYECHLTLDRKALLAHYRESRRSHEPSLGADRLDKSVAMAEDQLVIDALLHYRERRNGLGVVSLSENPLQLLMWAHYADEHRGAVVELDMTHPALMPRSDGGATYSDIRKVEYTQLKVSGLPWPNTIVNVLSTKSTDWSYEREWRLIRTLNLTRELTDSIHVVDFDLSAIRTIYLGAHFDARHLSEIVRLTSCADHSKPEILKVDIAPDRFELRAINAESYGWKLIHREYLFGEAAPEAMACLPMDDESDALNLSSSGPG